MRSFFRLALAGAMALTFGVRSASADQISYFLDTPNDDLSGQPSPFAEVTVNRTSSTTANFTFTAQNSYVFGANKSVAANINASDFSVSNVAGNASGGNAIYSVDLSDGNVAGFGRFNLAIDSRDFGPSNRSTTITFTVTDKSGTWASASAITTWNDATPAHFLAAHIGVGSDASPTGFVSAVPEPGPLLGAGVVTLMGLGYTWRRRRATA